MQDPPIWDLECLRAHIQKRGPAFLHLGETVSSMGRMDLIAKFHLFNARDGLRSFMSGSQDAEAFFQFMAGGAQQQKAELESIAIEAHLIGAMHSIRNSFDIFSHLINGLLLKSRFPVQACDIRRVAAALPSSPLRTALGEVLGGPDFKYVSGFVNTTKHRKVVKNAFKADFTLDRSGHPDYGIFLWR